MLALTGVLSTAPARAQSSTAVAKAEGKAFGREKAANAQSAATTDPDAVRIPNFESEAVQSGYFDNPDAMAGAAADQSGSHQGYQAMRSSIDQRVRFAPVDLDATIARSKRISEDPLAYTSGMTVSGTQGRCVPLPAATGTSTRYFATCNIGVTASEEQRELQYSAQCRSHANDKLHLLVQRLWHPFVQPRRRLRALRQSAMRLCRRATRHLSRMGDPSKQPALLHRARRTGHDIELPFASGRRNRSRYHDP